MPESITPQVKDHASQPASGDSLWAWIKFMRSRICHEQSHPRLLWLLSFHRMGIRVAALHPPWQNWSQRPPLAAPEVSRPIADTPVAAQQPTEPQAVKSPAEAPHIPRWGVWLATDVSEDRAWTLYRERARQFASLIGVREPIVLSRQMPGMGNAKRYVIAIVDDDRAPLDKFCKKLTAAGSTCNVMRNEIGPD